MKCMECESDDAVRCDSLGIALCSRCSKGIDPEPVSVRGFILFCVAVLVVSIGAQVAILVFGTR